MATLRLKTFLARLPRLALVSLALGFAHSAPAAICDVEIDLQYNLFVITVDGQPFKGKRYIAYEDVVMLRDVLVETGECRLPATVYPCEVIDTGEGAYTVMRGGVDFSGLITFTSRDGATQYANELEADEVCVFE